MSTHCKPTTACKSYTPESNIDWQWLPRWIVHNSMMCLQQNIHGIMTQKA